MLHADICCKVQVKFKARCVYPTELNKTLRSGNYITGVQCTLYSNDYTFYMVHCIYTTHTCIHTLLLFYLSKARDRHLRLALILRLCLIDKIMFCPDSRFLYDPFGLEERRFRDLARKQVFFCLIKL